MKFKNLFGLFGLFGLLLPLVFTDCNHKPQSKNLPIENGSALQTPYTVTLSNSGGSFTVTGATSVKVQLPDGTIVFPCSKDTITTPPIVVNPPISTDTSSILFGINTNHWQPKQADFQSVRCYLPIGWAFTEKGMYAQPLKQGQKTFLGVDDYLGAMKKAKTDVLLCLMQSPDWLNGVNSFGLNTNDSPPLRHGLNREDPNSYAEVANIYKAFAIRYGSKKWPNGSYKVDPAPPRWTGDQPQVYKSGLDLVKYIEVGNELDRWWKIGTPEYMTPKEHAAFLIACYDSIKVADPSLVVVMAGLTNYDYKYLEQMKAFCDARGRKFPCDVINVHHYNNKGNLLGVHPPTWFVNGGCSPESDQDNPTLKKCVDFAKGLGLPCWLTEFGYDSQPNSQMSPTPILGQTNEQTQAQWNVRAALEAIRLGASRAYVFTIADEPNASAGLFQSCGLLRGESSGYVAKHSFTDFVALNKELAGYKYASDESTSTVRIMKFKGSKGKTKYVYWLPSSEGKTSQSTIKNVAISATENVKYITLNN